MSRQKQFIAGICTGLPVIIGFIPVGIAYAIMAHQANFSPGETILMSVMVFAGASQIMAAGMYAQGMSLTAIVIAAFILNLRHLIMSTCVANRLGEVKTGLKLLAAFGVTDESFAIYTTSDEDKCTIWFFLGLVSVTYLAWIFGAVVGVFASSFLPQIISASFGVAIYAMFIGLLIPGIRKNLRLFAVVVISALLSFIFSRFLASSWAVIAGALVGAAVGMFIIGEDISSTENTAEPEDNL